MKSIKVMIKANDNKHTVDIPEEYVGKNIVVSFIEYIPPKKKVNPKNLSGILKNSGKSLDEYREERLLNK